MPPCSHEQLPRDESILQAAFRACLFCNLPGALTEDVLGELVLSNRVLGTTEILLLNHTGCGFTTFTGAELNAKLSASTGDASPAPMRFFSYQDPEQNTREQINTLRSHPWFSKDVPVRGFIFDMETGLLREVQPIAKHAAA